MYAAAIALVVLVGTCWNLKKVPANTWESPTADLRRFVLGVVVPVGYLAACVLAWIGSKFAHLF